MADTPCDYDSPWKEALAHYFDGFVALFAPTLHAVIDWSHPPVFLDKEFQASSGRGKSGRRYVDALAAIQTNGTSPVSVFVHVEVQSGHMGSRLRNRTPPRVYEYVRRIFDRHLQDYAGTCKDLQKPGEIFSLCVLTASQSGRPFMEYVREFHGCRTHFRFPVVHLRHWFKLWDYLEKSAQKNPFAMVVMAQLLAEKHRKGAPRVDAKIRLFRFLSQLSYAPHDMQQLARIIDWFLVLPAHFQEIFDQEMQSLKKDLNMTFITSFERNGIKQGMQLGLQKGLTCPQS